MEESNQLISELQVKIEKKEFEIAKQYLRYLTIELQ